MTNKQKMLYLKEKISGSQANIPVDKLLTVLVDSFSRRQIRKELDAGHITLNGRRVRRASQTARAGDLLELRCPDHRRSPEKRQLQPETLDPSHIIYQDDHTICLNKPPFLLSQASKNQNHPHVISVMQKLPGFQPQDLPEGLFLCHRLDKETSGVLLLASQPQQAEFLMNQFRERKTKKQYLALCHGIPADKEWKSTHFLSPIDKQTGNVRVVHSGGKKAVTSFRLLEAFPEHKLSLLSCSPDTGRGHQIRVQLEACGFSIVGDKRYGARKALPPSVESLISHHLLHARKLGFFPAAESPMLWVEAALPTSFQKVLDVLRTGKTHGK
ncbi:MAG: RluA family pseudouridine synthase [Deltaproteobacteria bacterium]|nr:RluA family pseudouridine synthase [Deltaproteobacteria bacterium]